MEIVLGIDLGTTNSVVSIVEEGQPRLLGEENQFLLPSVVGLDAEGNVLVGHAAQNQMVLSPDRTVASIKRKMGSDERVRLGDQDFSPEEVSAIILRRLKELAKNQLGQDVEKAVITVPAFFNEQQREATRRAGELAGLQVIRIINEPTAASLTYDSKSESLQRLIVYDLGGGTFDVSVVQIEKGVIEVLASHGDTKLGGDDFDQLLLDHVCDKFQKEQDVDLRQTLTSKSRVLRAVEEAKKRLSFEPYTKIQEEFIAESADVPLHLQMEISRLDYEEMIESLLDKTLVCVDEALSDCKLSANQIDQVILVGGASRTPLVHRLLEEQLEKPIHLEVDPDLCVAMGAAIQGSLIDGHGVGPVLVDITPHTMGIQCQGHVDGMVSSYCFQPLIRRNTPLPASRSELFSTVHDGQDAALISVFQGEYNDSRLNDHIGEFRLSGLADVKQGNEIVVRFDLDPDGILKVSAMERRTGLADALVIDNAISDLHSGDFEESKSRVESAFRREDDQESAAQMVSSADEPSSSDQSPELIEAIQAANTLIEKSESISNNAAPEDAEEVIRLVHEIRGAIRRQSLGDIKTAIAALNDLVFYLQDA